MNDTVIQTIIAAFAGAIASMPLINWRLKQVEKRLDEHNNYAKKFNDISVAIEVMKENIKNIKEQIDTFINK